MKQFTSEQLIKWILIDRYNTYAELEGQESITDEVTPDTVDDLYEDIEDVGELKYELREGEVETNIVSLSRRYYESSVAAKAPNGQWVGWSYWPYWYGACHNSEPDAVDWMNESYLLGCTEERKMITIRTFSKE